MRLMVITEMMRTTRISVHRPVLRFQIKTPLVVRSVARRIINFVDEVLSITTSSR